MIKVTKYLLTLFIGCTLAGFVSAGDMGTGKGGNFKKDTFSKDNFNKSGEGLTPPNPNNGTGGYEIPVNGSILLLVLGGMFYFTRRIGSELKKDRNATDIL